MQSEMRSHRLVIAFITGWIAIFLYMLYTLGAHRSETRVEAEAILLLTNIVAVAFIYVGMGEILAAARVMRSVGIRQRTSLSYRAFMGRRRILP